MLACHQAAWVDVHRQRDRFVREIPSTKVYKFDLFFAQRTSALVNNSSLFERDHYPYSTMNSLLSYLIRKTMNNQLALVYNPKLVPLTATVNHSVTIPSFYSP